MHILNIYRYAVCSAAFLAILGGCSTMPNKSARSLDLNDTLTYAEMNLMACLDFSATDYIASTTKNVNAAIKHAFGECDSEFERYIDVLLERVAKKNNVTEFAPIVRPTVERDTRSSLEEWMRTPLQAYARGELELVPFPSR